MSTSPPITAAPPIITSHVTTNEHQHSNLARNTSILIFGVVVSYLVYLSMSNLSPAKEVSLTEGARSPIAVEKTQEEADLSVASMNVDDEPFVDNDKDFVAVPDNDFASMQMPDIDISLLSTNASPAVEDIKLQEITPPIAIKAVKTKEAVEVKEVEAEVIIEVKEAVEIVEVEKTKPITVIQPFGGLSWDDDLFEIIQKIQKIESLESISLLFGTSYKRTSKRNIKTVSSEPHLQEVLALSSYGNKYVLGIDKKVFAPQIITIDAKPIIIANGAFSLRIIFQSEPSYVLENKKRALDQAKQVSGDDADFYFPLRLSSVSLYLFAITDIREPTTKDDKTLTNNIYDLLREKHPSSWLHQPTPYKVIWRDNAKHELSLEGGRNQRDIYLPRTRIEYSNSPKNDHRKELEALQKKITDEAYKKKFADKKDSGRAL